MNNRKKVISAESIQKRVKELGREISRDFQGKELLVIGILMVPLYFLPIWSGKLTFPFKLISFALPVMDPLLTLPRQLNFPRTSKSQLKIRKYFWWKILLIRDEPWPG